MIKMRKGLYILSMAVVTLFASCQKDTDIVSSLTEDKVVSFSAKSNTPLTRVTGTNWDEGDAIGICAIKFNDETILYDNIKYKAKPMGDGATTLFVPDSDPIYYVEGGSSVLLYYAYYPYREEWSYEDNDMIVDLSVQDGTQENQDKVDILHSFVKGPDNDEPKVFQFEHAFCKVQIAVSNYEVESAFENLDNITATLQTKHYQINACEEGVIESDERKPLGMVKTIDGDKAIFTAIFMPGEVSDQIVFTDGENSYTADFEIDKAISGKLYSFTATVGDQGKAYLEVTTDGVDDWNSQGDVSIGTEIEITGKDCKIYTAKGLKIFAEMVNSGQTSLNGKLMNNIDLEGSEDNQWTPIGNDPNKYWGIFDGDGFEISGLYINSNSKFIGLFGRAKNATIKNLSVDGCIEGVSYIGGILGFGEYINVLNCQNNATITGEHHIGGVVGYHLSYDKESIVNCGNKGIVKGLSKSYTVGGIVGCFASRANITLCCNMASVSGNGNVGAIVGEVSYNSKISSSFYDSDVYKGGGIGRGIVVSTQGFRTEYMQSEGFVAKLNNAAYTYNQTNPGVKVCAWKKVENGYPELDFDAEPTFTHIDIECVDGVYEIYTATGLKAFADKVNKGEKTINGKLMKDITLSDNWTPIGTDQERYFYSGTFDGNGYSIKELNVKGSVSGLGLFGSCKDATIKNLKVGGTVSSSHGHAALIAGKVWDTTIENCETLEGSSVVATRVDAHAGIVGYVCEGTIKNCINNASVKGTLYVAGIVGYSSPWGQTTISNCLNRGNISSREGQIGGIVGRLYSNHKCDRIDIIVNCANSGSVSSDGNHAGGLVGVNCGGKLYNSYNRGNVKGKTNVGGLAGVNEVDNYTAEIKNCYTSAEVKGTGHVGLAVGKNASSIITDCHYDSNKKGSAIGLDNKKQSVKAFTDCSVLLKALNGKTSSIKDANRWIKGGDGYPTFEFIK